MEIEKEIKVLGIDLDKLEEKIISLGGVKVKEEKQENTLLVPQYFDLPESNYCRIRVNDDLLTGEISKHLTFKKKLEDGKYRKNKEYNLEIQDEEICLAILDNLGVVVNSVGYKHRIGYSFMGALIELDRWDEKTYPYPYAEIEVKDQDQLMDVIDALGIDQACISNKSLGDLQKELK